MPRPTAGLLRSLDIDAVDVRDVGRKFFVDVEKSKLPNNLTILEVGKYRIRIA
jgi:hypothetical protein